MNELVLVNIKSAHQISTYDWGLKIQQVS